jgi:hypothetical protein
MRSLLRFGLAAAVGVSLGGAALAQTNGTGGTDGGGTTGGGTGGGGGAGPVLGQVMEFQTPSALDQSLGNQIGASSLNQSNILGRYYANPLYQGRAGAQTGEIPGGFGQPLYTSTTGFGGTTGGRTGTTGFGGTGGRTTTGTGFGTTGGRTGTTGFGGAATGFGGTTTGFGGATGFGGGRTGFGGTTGFGGATGFGGTTGLGGGRIGLGGLGGAGGLGGRTGLGGFGGAGMTNTAQVVPLSRQISYTATLRVPQAAPAAVASRIQTEARAVIDRSSAIANPAGVQVATDGPVVVLRGSARDEDEARLIENMIRLTPGVRDVRNELQFPGQQPQP